MFEWLCKAVWRVRLATSCNESILNPLSYKADVTRHRNRFKACPFSLLSDDCEAIVGASRLQPVMAQRRRTGFVGLWGNCGRFRELFDGSFCRVARRAFTSGLSQNRA